MKKLNLLKKATPLLLLAAMSPVMATDFNVSLDFTTLPVISIVEIQPLNFGAVLSLTLADTCAMDTVLGTLLTATQEGTDATSAVFSSGSANSAGALTGNCAGAADGQPGIYEITSFSDAPISVTISPGVATAISFVPAGYVTDLVEGSAFARQTLTSGGAAVGANASATLTAFAQAGTNRAIIGGEITNFTALAAGMPYATDFNLNVVYQ